MNGREVQNIKGFEIYIEGDNNKIEISLSEKSEIFSSKIYISGSKNLIQILAPKLLDHLNIFVGQSHNKIYIAENTSFHNAFLYVGYVTGQEDSSCQLHIGKDFTCNAQLHLSIGNHRKISIGDDCMFSWNVYVWVADGHLIFDKATGERLNQEQDVKIGNHVWVGRHASVHKGAIVPDGCIVGANSFVTKAFRENNVILAGTPAKVVRQNIRWER